MFIKVCGTTSEQDALLAVAMGADAVGFVFSPSPRQIAPAVAADIAKRLPPEILTVGVFRDEAPERVIDITLRGGLKGAQLHGHETASEAKWVRSRVPFTIKAFSAGDPMLAEADQYGADAILIDGPTPGSGRVFDWELAGPLPDRQRLVLAGGLTADNVAMAIEQVRPWGIDVVTGVEAEPGRKDARKLRAFVAAAREVDPSPAWGARFDDAEAEGAPSPAVYDWRDE